MWSMQDTPTLVINVMWFNKLPSNISIIYLVAVQVFCSSSSRHSQHCWALWCTFYMYTYIVNSELQSTLYGKQVSLQTKVNFSLRLSGLVSVSHLEKLFTNFWDVHVVSGYKFILDSKIFCEWKKLMSWVHVGVEKINVMGTCGFILQSDWYRQSRDAGSWQLFQWMLPGSLFPPPSILRRESGMGMRLLKISTEESSLYVCPAAFRSPRSTC